MKKFPRYNPLLLISALAALLWWMLPLVSEPGSFLLEKTVKIKSVSVIDSTLKNPVVALEDNQTSSLKSEISARTVLYRLNTSRKKDIEIKHFINNNSESPPTDNSIADHDELIYSNEFNDDFEQWTGDKSIWQMGAPVYGPTDLCANDSMCIGTLLDQPYPDYEPAMLSSSAIAIPSNKSGEEIQLSLSNWFEIDQHDHIKISISYAIGEDNWTDPEILLAQSGRSQGWKNIEINLSKYAGESIKLHFELAQNKEIKGVDSGWYIDDLQIFKIRKSRKREAL